MTSIYAMSSIACNKGKVNIPDVEYPETHNIYEAEEPEETGLDRARQGIIVGLLLDCS